VKILKGGQQQAFSSAKAQGTVVNKMYHQAAGNQLLAPAGTTKNQNFVQGIGQSAQRGEAQQVSATQAGATPSSAAQQNRNFEIQT
jgi:hypothetical protein